LAKKALVVYFSWTNGNTKRIAEQLQKALGADIERLETVVPYDGSYNEVVSQAQDEVRRGYKPELRPLTHRPEDYEVIAVGTPTWWYTMAPAVKSFLEGHDFAGKTVIPFMTNAGWPGKVLKDMAKAARGADVIDGKEIRFDSSGGDRMVSPEKDVENWIHSVVQRLA
jgi:flavodoxin